MNKTNIRTFLILSYVCFFVGQSFYAEYFAYEKIKTINESFSVSEDDMVEIINKFGLVNIDTWDKKEANFDIEIIVKAGSERKVNELLDGINVAFDQGNNKISAETFIEKSNNWSWGNSVKYEINYRVTVPKSVFLNVKNKYGNTNIASMSRNISAYIKYGDITMEDQLVDLDLYVGYGKAKLNYVKQIKADIKYSDFDCESAQVIDMESKYSQIRIKEVEELVSDSGYDDYNITKVKNFKNNGKYDDMKLSSVGRIDIDTKYTELEVGDIFESGNFEQRYGDITIDNIEKSARELSFDLEYVDVFVRQINSEYQVALEGQYIDFDFPDSFKESYFNREAQTLKVTGSRGDGLLKIDCVMRYGSFQIR